MKSIYYPFTRVPFSLLLAVLFVGGASICCGQAPAVPSEYQDLYATLSGDIGDFNTAISGVWTGSTYPVLYAGELTNANSNNTGLLTSSGMQSVQNDLTFLKALGVQAVAVEVSFPALYEPFYSSQTQYQQYVTYYAQVAAAVRAQGFKLIVESQSMMPSGIASGWGPQLTTFYPTLNWTQYQAARAQAAQVVAQTMQPDYFVLQEEPDTEATQTGQTNVDTVAGSISMLNQTASSVLAAGVPNMKIGAGLGSWLSGFQGFILGFTGQQCSATQPCVTVPLDFIDMHIYPINELGSPSNSNFWQNALTIVSMAQAAGKPVTLSQTWLRKVRNSEWGVLDGDTQESREVFSFWEPLDSAFLQTIVNLANYSQMLFMNPWDTPEFSSYLTYTASDDSMSPDQLYTGETTAASATLLQGIYSPTGMSYYSAIVSPPDTVPPSTPTNLIATAASPTLVNLSWNPSTDNVGVAGYSIVRNGVQIATSALTTFQDTGTAGYTTYTYQIQAYDLAPNVSQPASVTVKTPSSSAPDPPANMAGTTISAQQINLSWSAPTSGVIPTSYRVFRGTSFENMTQIQTLGGSSVSYNNYSLAAGTPYYYGVEGVTNGLSSGMSLIVASTFPLPTAPSNPVATANSGKQITITWSPSTGSLPISSYKVFCGTSPSSLSQLAQTTKTSYIDTTVTAGTTYYCAVEAIDSKGDVSPMSATVSVTPPGPPSAPTNVTATASSAKMVKVAWTAAVSNGLAVSNYHVYRGTSSTGLTQLGITTATTYTDNTVSAGTVYYYGIEATDTGGDVSAMSALASLTTPSMPSAPTGLTATPISSKQISLSWTASVSGGLPISSYHIMRGTSPSNLSQIATSASTSYKDGTVAAGTTYYYAVYAVDSGGDDSPTSASVSITAPAPPAAPTNVSGTAVTHRQISVTWSAPVGGALPIVTYHVYRGSTSSNLAVVSAITAPTTSFTDNSVSPNTTYYYAVQAIDSGNDTSVMSAVVTVTTPN